MEYLPFSMVCPECNANFRALGGHGVLRVCVTCDKKQSIAAAHTGANHSSGTDAQLIAAAPESLAALRGAAEALREAGRSFALHNPLAARPNLFEAREAAAREAIARAEGR